jgi:hypothetical protein
MSTTEMPATKKARIEDEKIEEETPEDCAICLEPMDGAREINTLRCKHKFHDDCVQQIIMSKLPQCCSLCRDPFVQGLDMDSRKRSIDLHIRLLEHVSECNSTDCPARTCGLMKGIVDHNRTCSLRSPSGDACSLCRRFVSLVVLHSVHCRPAALGQPCPVPHCDMIRARRAELMADAAAAPLSL